MVVVGGGAHSRGGGRVPWVRGERCLCSERRLDPDSCSGVAPEQGGVAPGQDGVTPEQDVN